MKIELRSVEPSLICLACSGVISQPVKADSDPLQPLLPHPDWAGHILLDFSRAEYIATAGIAWLIHWGRRQEKVGAVLGLHGVPTEVADMLRLCRLHLSIPLWENEAEARTALAARPTMPRVEKAPEKTLSATIPRRTAESEPVDDSRQILSFPAGVKVAAAPAVAAPPPVSPADSGPKEAIPAANPPRLVRTEKEVTVLIVDDSAVERHRASGA
jgi:hypothetical protein